MNFTATRLGFFAAACFLAMSARAQTPDVAALETAVRTNPTATNRLNLSLAYLDAGRADKAKPVLTALLAADRTNAAAWNNLCVAQIELQELKDAHNDCERALGLDPSFALAKNNLVWSQSSLDAEVAALNSLETTAPGARDREFYLAEGLHEMHLGQPEAAICSWQRMLFLHREDAVAANNIGSVLMSESKPQLAASWFEKAVAWEPTLAIAKNNLAWARSESRVSP